METWQLYVIGLVLMVIVKVLQFVKQNKDD
jgi:hypothetical protein